MDQRGRAVIWIGVIAAASVALWLLSPILPPFVLGMAIAYFIDPVVARLERAGLSRATAAGAIVLGAFVVGVVMLLVLVPVVIDQASDLAAGLPGFVDRAGAWARPWLDRVFTSERRQSPLAGPLAEAAQQASSLLAQMARNLLGQGLALLNLAMLLSITPVVTFYLLRDWPRFLAHVDDGLPRAYAPVIRARAREIDDVLAGFARGSATVCLVLALFYAVALSLIGLDFGFVIGLGAGLLSFVPYLGFIVGLLASVGVAIWQFWPSWLMPAVTLAIFLTGQLVTDYVLTPKLVGDRVGLHPLWMIFGVMAGGILFGFSGVLLAVPGCAVAGVLARFILAQYKQSTLYGAANDTPDP